MSLSPGTRLGLYEIVAMLGEGGMGEVYRARDTKLGREVAIKVVLGSVIADAERAARFRREAQVLASLNHTNIATLYGMEEAGGRHFLVMELVDGEDLSQRIARGALSLAEALPVARQIADALEAAHDSGIIHRDLKPANIKVKTDGTVKVLDFGLAKALDPTDPATASSLSNSPTLTARATQMGMILGTAAYMSPEQARGKPVDRRADIWAFGCVLYEMLTGHRAFEGDDISTTLASVLKDDVSWQSLPPDLPPSLRRLLRRCLEKDPRKRLSAISDARLEIEDVSAPDRDGTITANTEPPPPAWRRSIPYAIGAFGLVVGGAAVALWPAAAAPVAAAVPVSRFVLPMPADAPFVVHSSPGRAIAISSDGTQIAYTTHDQSVDTRIRVRRLDDTDIRSIPGTEKARAPFFSPDGKWLAYFDWPEKTLKKVSVLGNQSPVALQRGLSNAGWLLGSWCDDGRIVFDTWNGGLRVMGDDGTGLQSLTEPKDEWHLDPQPLPGPCRVLYYTYRADGYAIYAVSADGGTPTKILDNASHGRYLESGHLLFVRDGALHIAPFDADRLKVTGPTVPAPLEVAPDWYVVGAPNPQLAISRNGTLVYAPVDGTIKGSPIVLVTRDGQLEDVGVAPFLFPVLSLSPNGEELLLSGRRAGRALIDTFNLSDKGTANILDAGMVDAPTQAIWIPNGKAILYARYGPYEGEVVRHERDGGAPDQVVARVSGTWICPWSVSPDGRWLIVARYDPKSQNDLLLVDLSAPLGTSSVKTLVAGLDEEGLAAISPDGQWFAYTSDRGDGREVFIEKFPEGGQKVRVGPTRVPPVWSRNGDELYFMSYEPKSHEVEMMAARVTFAPRLTVSAPKKLFSGSFEASADTGRSFALTHDGKRFVMVKTPPGMPPSQGTGFATRLIVVQNWFAELTPVVSRLP